MLRPSFLSCSTQYHSLRFRHSCRWNWVNRKQATDHYFCCFVVSVSVLSPERRNLDSPPWRLLSPDWKLSREGGCWSFTSSLVDRKFSPATATVKIRDSIMTQQQTKNGKPPCQTNRWRMFWRDKQKWSSSIHIGFKRRRKKKSEDDEWGGGDEGGGKDADF